MRAITVRSRILFFPQNLRFFSIFFTAYRDVSPHKKCRLCQLILGRDVNVDSVTKGYKVYYGTKSGVYDSSIDVGNTISYKIDALQAGTIYYLAATAYDSNGNESDFSEELVVKTPRASRQTPSFLRRQLL